MNEMTNDLLRTVDRLFESACTRETRETAEAGIWPAAMWQELEDTGLAKAALPESSGSPGVSFEDAMAALKRSAYHAAPVPLAETMLAGRLLCAAGIDAGRPAHPWRGTLAPASLSWTAAAGYPGRRSASWGEHCRVAVVVADCAGVETVCLVSTEGASRQNEKNLGGDPRVLLAFEGAPVQASAALPGARDRLLAEGALYRSVQMAGALERILAYSLQYAGERVQFGRPIGKFQAVQHMLALLAGHAAASSAAADAAVEASINQPNEFAVAVAKARIGEAAGKGAEIAHQIHAAMGYTREHNLHFSSRRLWAWHDAARQRIVLANAPRQDGRQAGARMRYGPC